MEKVIQIWFYLDFPKNTSIDLSSSLLLSFLLLLYLRFPFLLFLPLPFSAFSFFSFFFSLLVLLIWVNGNYFLE